METKTFKYIAVAYKLYADIDGEKQLVEETTDGQPYQYISGMGMTEMFGAVDPIAVIMALIAAVLVYTKKLGAIQLIIGMGVIGAFIFS